MFVNSLDESVETVKFSSEKILFKKIRQSD